MNNKKTPFYNVLPSPASPPPPRRPIDAEKKENGNGNGKMKSLNINLSNIKSKAYSILSSFYQGAKESYSTVVDYTDTNVFHTANEIQKIDKDVEVKIETRMIVTHKQPITTT